MTDFENKSTTNNRTNDDPSPITEYALRVTDTAIWEWNIPEDHISLYPRSQTVFESLSNLDDFLSHVHPADKQEVIDELGTAVEETGEFFTEFRLANEEERWVAAQGKVDYDEANDPERLIGVVREVSKEKQTYRQLKRFRDHIAETELVSEIGGWELKVATNELWWTQGTKEIHDVPLDYDPTIEEALEFYHLDDKPTIEKAVQQCLKHGEPYHVEVRLITAEGNERWVHCRGERVQRGDTNILRGVIRDITKQKIRDQRLAVLNRVLRHNIRNSLGVVMGNAELLHKEIEALAPLKEYLAETASFSVDDTRHLLSKITTNAEQLAEIAEDARRLSRVLERGPVRYYVDAPVVVDRVVTKLADQYPDARICVEKEEEVGVRGNEESLEMALSELVENAILHTQQASPTVKISISKVDKKRVSIQVTDTGPGIPEMEQEVLRKGTEEPLMHGRGIGLWMVNWLMTQLGGSISLEDNDPSGTVVTLKLPAATSE